MDVDRQLGGSRRWRTRNGFTYTIEGYVTKKGACQAEREGNRRERVRDAGELLRAPLQKARLCLQRKRHQDGVWVSGLGRRTGLLRGGRS